MKRKINIIGLTLFFTLTLFSLAFSEESITITTYYPSPYGSYNELTTTGNTYLATNSGRVGIGTTAPGAMLEVGVDPNGGDIRLAGATGVNAYTFTTKTSNDLEINVSSGIARYMNLKNTGVGSLGITTDGNVGIGTASPTEALEVRRDGVPSFIRMHSSAVRWYNIGVGASPGNFEINDMSAAGANRLTIATNGNVGIRTASPTAKLHVAGNIKAVLNDIDGGSPANMRYNSGTNEIGFDIAELFETNEEVEPGDVLCIDENGKLKKNTVAYDTKVAGVVSEAPAILFEGSQLQIAPQPFEFRGGSKPPLALAGRVQCKVIVQETGPIKVGDLLVTSSKPGFATKADTEKVRIGTVLGKTLESLNEGEGKILILVTLQ